MGTWQLFVLVSSLESRTHNTLPFFSKDGMGAKHVQIPTITSDMAKKLTAAQKAVIVRIKKGTQKISDAKKRLYDRQDNGKNSVRYISYIDI